LKVDGAPESFLKVVGQGPDEVCNGLVNLQCIKLVGERMAFLIVFQPVYGKAFTQAYHIIETEDKKGGSFFCPGFEMCPGWKQEYLSLTDAMVQKVVIGKLYASLYYYYYFSLHKGFLPAIPLGVAGCFNRR